jgi:hypothetical protein
MAANQQMSEPAAVLKLALLIRLIVAACRVRKMVSHRVRPSHEHDIAVRNQHQPHRADVRRACRRYAFQRGRPATLGIMIFGIGVLMVVAAFRPWLRFETMLFSTIEKAFMVYLFLSNLGQPWVMGYIGAFLLDSTIVACSIVYFISDQGRPVRWIATIVVDPHQ